jgi:hypothetical protein
LGWALCMYLQVAMGHDTVYHSFPAVQALTPKVCTNTSSQELRRARQKQQCVDSEGDTTWSCTVGTGCAPAQRQGAPLRL